MDNNQTPVLNQFRDLKLAQRLEGLDKLPQWEALLDYLKEQEQGCNSALGQFSDLWEPHVTIGKVGKINGILLLCRLIRAIPGDVTARLRMAVEKGELK